MSGLFSGTPLERPITCEWCGLPHARCTCPRGANGKVLLPKDQAARVRREKRRGKVVTVVAGLDEHATDLAAMCSKLKSMLGAGGSVTRDEKDGATIEIQGDHRDKVLAHLKGLGYPAKAAGG